MTNRTSLNGSLLNGATAAAIVVAAVSFSAEGSFEATATGRQSANMSLFANVQSVFASQGNIFARWQNTGRSLWFADPRLILAGSSNWEQTSLFQPLVLKTAFAEAVFVADANWYSIADAELGDVNFLARLTVDFEATQQRAAQSQWSAGVSDFSITESTRIAGTTLIFEGSSAFRGEASVQRNGETFVEHDGFFLPVASLLWESTQFLEEVFTTGGFQTATADIEIPAHVVHGASGAWSANAELTLPGARVVLPESSWAAGVLFDANQTLIHRATPEAFETSASITMRANGRYAPTVTWRASSTFLGESNVRRGGLMRAEADAQLSVQATVVKLGFSVYECIANAEITGTVIHQAEAAWNGINSTMKSSSVLRNVPAGDERIFTISRVDRKYFVSRRTAIFEAIT